MYRDMNYIICIGKYKDLQVDRIFVELLEQ